MPPMQGIKSNDGKQTAQAALNETLNKQTVVENQQLLVLRRMEQLLAQTARASQQPGNVLGAAFTQPSSFKPFANNAPVSNQSTIAKSVDSLAPIAASARELQDAFTEATKAIRSQVQVAVSKAVVGGSAENINLGKAFTQPDTFKSIVQPQQREPEVEKPDLGKAFTQPDAFKPFAQPKVQEPATSTAIVPFGSGAPPLPPVTTAISSPDEQPERNVANVSTALVELQRAIVEATQTIFTATSGFRQEEESPDEYVDAEYSVKRDYPALPDRTVPLLPAPQPVEAPKVPIPDVQDAEVEPPIIPYAQVAPEGAKEGRTEHWTEIERRKREQERKAFEEAFPPKPVRNEAEDIPAFEHTARSKPQQGSQEYEVNPAVINPPETEPEDKSLSWREKRARRPRPDLIDPGALKRMRDQKQTLIEMMPTVDSVSRGDPEQSKFETSTFDSLFPTISAASRGAKKIGRSAWNTTKKTIQGIPNLKKNVGKALSGAASLAKKGLYNAAKANVGKGAAAGLSFAGKAAAFTGKATARLASFGASKAFKGVRSAFNAPANAVKGALDFGKSAAGALGSTPVVQASQALIESFQSLTRQMSGFVEALSPATVQLFQRTMRDLNAVIGVALLPGMQIATGIVRKFADVLLPITEKLQPIVAQVGGSVAQLAGVFTNTFGSVLTTLTPVIKVIADVFQAVTPVIQAVIAVFSGMVEVVAVATKGLLAMFGVNTSDMTKNLRSALERLATAVLQTAAAVLKFFNAAAGNAFIDGVKKALVGDGVETKSSSGLAAAQNAQIGSIQSYMQSVLRASLLAGPQGRTDEKDPLEWQKKTVEKLDEIKNMTQESIRDIAVKIGEEVGKAVYNYLKDKPREVFNAAQQQVSSGIGTIGDYTGANWIGEQIGEFLFPSAR